MNLRNKLQWNLSRNPKFSFMKMSSAKCQMSWAMIFTLKASTIWTPVYILMIYILYNFSYCILRNLALFFRMLSSQSMIKIIKIKTWRNRTWRIARSRARQNSRCWWKQVWHVGCECQVNRLIGNFCRCVTRVATVISTLLVSWELVELSLNSQGTHRLFQPLPTPITNSCVRHCQGTGAHMSLTHTHTGRTQSSGSAPQALYSTLHKCLSQATLRADSRPRSQPTQGYSRSSALSLSGRPDSSASDTQRPPLLGLNTRRCHGRSCALPGICNATCSGEHSVSHTTFFPVFFWSSGACAVLDTF